MSKQELHIKLLDYLYEELSTDEKHDLEATLAKDPDLVDRLRSLSEIRTGLEGLTDEPIKESLVLPLQIKSGSSSWHRILHNPWLQAVAAAILLLITAALLDLRVSFQEREFSIQFGSPLPNEQVLTLSEWQKAQTQQQNYLRQVVAQQLAYQQDTLKTSLSELDQTFTRRWQRLEAQYAAIDTVPTEITLNDRQVRMLRNQLMRENYQMLTDLVEYSNSYHREYTEKLLSDFATYMEQRRTEDLQLISKALNDVLEQSDLQQQETELLLAQLITQIQLK